MVEMDVGLGNALKIVEEDYNQLPDGRDLIEKIHKKFLQFYEDPKLSDLQNILKENLSLQDARLLIFSPSSDQIRF